MLSALGAEALARRVDGPCGTVLMLHRVRPPEASAFRPNAYLEVTPAFLNDVLSHLEDVGIPVVTLDDALERVACNRPGRFAVLTLDDGYRDNRLYAQPLFERYRVPYTIYIATGLVDGTANAWWLTLEALLRDRDRVSVRSGDRSEVLQTARTIDKIRAFRRIGVHLRDLDEAARDVATRQLAAENAFDISALLAREFMNWDEIARLAATPLATIGGHTVDHVSLSRMPEAAAREEIVRGLDRIEEQIGSRPVHFAYPYGDETNVSARDVELARAAGMRTAVTTRRGLLEAGDLQDPLAWPRLSLNGHFQSMPEFRILLSGVPFALERLAWRAAPFLRPQGRAVLPARRPG